MIFWFNIYFCIDTEVSTNKKTSVLYDYCFKSLIKLILTLVHGVPFSPVFITNYVFKRLFHAEKTVLSTSLLWLGSYLWNL